MNRRAFFKNGARTGPTAALTASSSFGDARWSAAPFLAPPELTVFRSPAGERWRVSDRKPLKERGDIAAFWVANEQTPSLPVPFEKEAKPGVRML
ncbi:hypothetical protein B4113_2905 [Geobacillus sp. B4113_201601]|nr:hypothetical protein B4113_2905 [Geobacillus sp. B4113_201601]